LKYALAVILFLLVLFVFWSPVLARLPAAPQSTTIQSLLSQLLTEGRNSVSPEVKERIREEVRAKLHLAPEFQLYNQAGVVFFARFYPLEALWAFQEAIERNPENPDLLNNTATVLLALDRKEEAEKLLLYLAKRWPDYAPALLNLSILYLREGKLQLAEECLELARKAEPGLPPTERLGVQLARSRGDSAEEARSALNWSYLDPKDSESLEALHCAPHAEVVAEANRRLAALPLPRKLVSLPEIEEDVRTFILQEERDHFFSKVLNHSTRKAAEPALSGSFRKEIPLEVWNSLSEKDRKVMFSYGFRPAQRERMLLPALEELKKARENYPFLAQVIQAYEDQFLRLAERAFKERRIQELIQKEGERQAEYLGEYMERLKEAAPQSDFGVASIISTQYLQEAFSSLIPAHRRVRSLLTEARAETVDALRRLWQAEAILIDMVPPEYQEIERKRLEEVASFANFHYAKAVVAWWQAARTPILMELRIHEEEIEAIQEEAAARDFEAWLSAQAYVERYLEEDPQDPEEPEEVPSLDKWLGIDLGIISVKYYDKKRIELSAGEGIVGEVKYDLERNEVWFGLGVGVQGTTMTVFGGEAKGMVVVHLDSSESPLNVGLNGKVTAKCGSPLGGVETDVVNETLWLVGGEQPGR